MSKARAFWIILVLLISGFVEISSYATLLLMRWIRGTEFMPISSRSLTPKHRQMIEDLLAGRLGYFSHSPTLGWTIKPGGSSGLYAANAVGIRAARDYSVVPPTNILRIASFGDSFVHGDDVTVEETWQELLMKHYPGLEVMNFGVSAYGVDQAFLRYQQDGVRFRPHIVLIGYMSENINRQTMVFRPFYRPEDNFPMAKPRYMLGTDGTLVLVPNPLAELSAYKDLLTDPRRVLPRLGAYDYFFHRRYKDGPFDVLPSVRVLKIATSKLRFRLRGVERGPFYDPASEAFRVTTRVLDLFVDTVARNGSLPVIVVFPIQSDFDQNRRTGFRRYEPLLAHFRTRGYRYVDLLDAFDFSARAVPTRQFGEYHYSPLGHRIVALYVSRYLEESALLGSRREGTQERGPRHSR